MFYTNDGDKQIAVKADSIALNTWTHVAGTFEAGANNQKLYINGSNTGVTNATNSALSANATALSIGNIAAAGQDFYGLIDEARVWNTTRTADEILDNKKVALRGDEMGMVGQWKFDMNLYDGTSGGDTAVTYASAMNGTYQRYAGGWSTVSAWYDATTLSTSDPIVLDLDGDGVSLVGRDAGVRFDIDQVEGAEATSWMGPGEGLLAMDLDGDGVISSMGEVFSNRFAGGNHTTSLDALATLDSNSDGMINALDTAFADILVWQDGDQDGSSAAGELQSLDSHGVASIDLGADSTYETGPDGTHIDARGEFTFADGSTSEYVEATFGFTDSVIALPLLPLLIVLAAVDLDKLGLPPSLVQSQYVSLYRIIAIVALVGWTTVARLVRGAALTIRERDFVLSARGYGAGGFRIMTVHILPNLISPVIVATTLSVGNVILLESVLSFLGLGIQPPIPSWGNLLTNAQELIWTAPGLAMWPGMLIFITVIALNFLGDGLQDALDPKATD